MLRQGAKRNAATVSSDPKVSSQSILEYAQATGSVSAGPAESNAHGRAGQATSAGPNAGVSVRRAGIGIPKLGALLLLVLALIKDEHSEETNQRGKGSY